MIEEVWREQNEDVYRITIYNVYQQSYPSIFDLKYLKNRKGIEIFYQLILENSLKGIFSFTNYIRL